MPRCTHCGKVNREGSLFCQDCGHKLEAAPSAPAPPAPARPATAANAVCGSCGTTNPPGMNFCKMCGTSLLAKPAAAPAPAPAAEAGKVTCPSCGKQTPAGFSFCQHCGQRLQQPSAAPVVTAPRFEAPRAVEPAHSEVVTAPGASPGGASLGVAATMAAQVSPTPPAGMPRPSTSARAPANNGDALAATMAPAGLSASAQAAIARATAPSVVARDTLMDTPLEPAAIGSLVSLNRDGSDGESVQVRGETFDIGRTEGGLKFPEDPYLAPRHARILVQAGKVILRPLDSVNGVFLRIHGTADLAPGDHFLVGKELLRYEPLAPEERDPPSLVEHGVRIFGTVPREAWGRLRQLTVAGTTRDLWHLVRAELVLGREEGDVTFPDDEFMSRRHAALKRVGPRARIEDLNSSNGTFVRLRGDRELKPGDVLRMGDQLLRFEG